MKQIRVHLKKRSYSIVVGSKLLASAGKFIRALNVGDDAIVITNGTVRRRYGKILESSLKKYGCTVRFLSVADTERSKSYRVAFDLLKKIAAYDVRRRVFIVALGGGVIGDLAGFVASAYKRGIAYVQIPTTLLAQVDSAIGGKVAVDLTCGKNLVGAFYQPRLVLSDISVLSSLGKKQIRFGLAEVIKYGLIADKPLFEYVQRKGLRLLASDKKGLEFIVSRCSRIKASIVENDEREEKGIRTLLNFGHTIGHALETASDYKGYTHGEAVAIGMVVAGDISVQLGLLPAQALYRIERLLSGIGFETRITGVGRKAILKAYVHDKKFTAKTNRFVLLTGIGKALVRKNIPLSAVHTALIKRFV